MSASSVLRQLGNNFSRQLLRDSHGHWRGGVLNGEIQCWSFFDLTSSTTRRLLHSLRVQPGAAVTASSWDRLKWSKKSLFITHISNLSNQAKPHTTIEISSGGGLLSDQAVKSSLKPDESKKQSSDEDEDKKAAENQVRALRITMYVMGGIILGSGMYIFFVYGAPMTDQKGNPIRDEFSDLPYIFQYGKRASAEIRNYVKYIVNPSRDKLLPDPVKPPYYQPPYTLVIELTDVLVHPEWTYKTGWRFKKRPGVDFFLSQIAENQFEVVIYTSEPGMTASPIVDVLDKDILIRYRLYRDSTKYVDGIHLKDLDRLNRDLSKVIVVDCNEKNVQQHRNNAIVLPKWKGNDDDRSLIDLAALLHTIGSSEVHDVRGVLEYYSDYPDPLAEFRRKQMILAQQQEEAIKKIDSKVAGPYSASSFLGSLFRKS